MAGGRPVSADGRPQARDPRQDDYPNLGRAGRHRGGGADGPAATDRAASTIQDPRAVRRTPLRTQRPPRPGPRASGRALGHGAPEGPVGDACTIAKARGTNDPFVPRSGARHANPRTAAAE